MALTLNLHQGCWITDIDGGFMCKIVKKGKLVSFDLCHMIYGWAGQVFYRYVQLRDYFSTKVKGLNSEELRTIIHT